MSNSYWLIISLTALITGNLMGMDYMEKACENKVNAIYQSHQEWKND